MIELFYLTSTQARANYRKTREFGNQYLRTAKDRR